MEANLDNLRKIRAKLWLSVNLENGHDVMAMTGNSFHVGEIGKLLIRFHVEKQNFFSLEKYSVKSSFPRVLL